MDKNKDKGHKMSPKDYAKILEKTDLISIALESFSGHIDKQNFPLMKGLDITIRDKISYDYNEEDPQLKVIQKFFLTGKSRENKKAILRITATFLLTYSTDSSFSERFFEIFKNMSLPVNSWPFFREFVQSITQRMGIAPLTLPLVKRA